MTYNGLSDMHSTAMIAYYMMTSGKEHAFVTHDQMGMIELQNVILEGKYRLKLTLETEAIDLLSSMLEVEQSGRPQAVEVMKHPFFWPKVKRLAFLLAVAYSLM